MCEAECLYFLGQRTNWGCGTTTMTPTFGDILVLLALCASAGLILLALYFLSQTPSNKIGEGGTSQ